MPTYEYVCKQCGHLFEIVQSMRDEALTECPECGGELRKVFAPPAISFKGSGFYATDHGKKVTKSAGDGEKSDKSDKGEKSDKTEPKKEAASEGTKKEPRNGASSGSSDAPKTSPSSSSGKSSDAGGSGS